MSARSLDLSRILSLALSKVKDMVSKYTDKILNDVKKIVGVIFGMRRDAMRLRPRSWKEPHLLLYQALDGKPHHTGIEMVSYHDVPYCMSTVDDVSFYNIQLLLPLCAKFIFIL